MKQLCWLTIDNGNFDEEYLMMYLKHQKKKKTTKKVEQTLTANIKTRHKPDDKIQIAMPESTFEESLKWEGGGAKINSVG